MRCRSFLVLCGLLACAVCLLGCESLAAYLATPEGQAAGRQAANGVRDVLANPVNPFAWYELISAGVLFALGVGGAKTVPKLAAAGGGAVKRTFMNSAIVEATEEPEPTVQGFKGA